MVEVRLIRCANCGATNRVPSQKIAQGLQPKCGRCKTLLSLSAEPRTVTDASFAEDVERSALPVLIDAWASWCGPCQMIAPIVDELAAELAGRVQVAKLNVDENPLTASRFGIRSIPTLLVVKDGREVDRIVGLQPKGEIVRRLQRVMA